MQRGHVGHPIPELVSRTTPPVTTMPMLATSEATEPIRSARAPRTGRAVGRRSGRPSETSPGRDRGADAPDDQDEQRPAEDGALGGGAEEFSERGRRQQGDDGLQDGGIAVSGMTRPPPTSSTT